MRTRTLIKMLIRMLMLMLMLIKMLIRNLWVRTRMLIRLKTMPTVQMDTAR